MVRALFGWVGRVAWALLSAAVVMVVLYVGLMWWFDGFLERLSSM